jgi:hypothetical protein
VRWCYIRARHICSGHRSDYPRFINNHSCKLLFMLTQCTLQRPPVQFSQPALFEHCIVLRVRNDWPCIARHSSMFITMHFACVIDLFVCRPCSTSGQCSLNLCRGSHPRRGVTVRLPDLETERVAGRLLHSCGRLVGESKLVLSAGAEGSGRAIVHACIAKQVHSTTHTASERGNRIIRANTHTPAARNLPV